MAKFEKISTVTNHEIAINYKDDPEYTQINII